MEQIFNGIWYTNLTGGFFDVFRTSLIRSVVNTVGDYATKGGTINLNRTKSPNFG